MTFTLNEYVLDSPYICEEVGKKKKKRCVSGPYLKFKFS